MKTKKNHKTPIKDILFSSSNIGLITGGLISKDLTEVMREEMAELEKKKIQSTGLTEKQQEEYDSLNKQKVLSEAQDKKRIELALKSATVKGLSQKQEEKLQAFKDRDGAEPELSQGAKTHIKEVWLRYEKGFKEDFSNKQMNKGLQAEEDAVNLISFVDGVMYNNNNRKEDKGRITKGNLTGACDVEHHFKLLKKKGIDDCKCSWNPRTFMSSGLTTQYEWQGRAYLYLYDADIFRLRYCLVDCPPDVYVDELKRFCWNNGIIDETLEEYAPLIEQFDRNFLYEHSGKYTQEERVKTFVVLRDLELEKIMLKSIELAIEYYKTITLNMID